MSATTVVCPQALQTLPGESSIRTGQRRPARSLAPVLMDVQNPTTGAHRVELALSGSILLYVKVREVASWSVIAASARCFRRAGVYGRMACVTPRAGCSVCHSDQGSRSRCLGATGVPTHGIVFRQALRAGSCIAALVGMVLLLAAGHDRPPPLAPTGTVVPAPADTPAPDRSDPAADLPFEHLSLEHGLSQASVY